MEDVKFDFARRVESYLWGLDESWQMTGVTNQKEYPLLNEEANDDPHENDESAAPDSDRHMYGVDAPGPQNHGYPGTKYQVHYLNAEEYMRVSFDGTDPVGNITAGTRASIKEEWHVIHTLEDDGSGNLQRTTGDDPEVPGKNEVALGRIELGDPLQPPPGP